MTYRFAYGNRVAVLPAAAFSHLHKASHRDIAVLFALALSPDAKEEELAASTGYTKEEVSFSLAFWYGTGVLQEGEDEKKAPRPAEKHPAAKEQHPHLDRGLPDYSTDELSDIIENRNNFQKLLDACQDIIGKVFNRTEVATIAGMVDYLHLDEEYVLTLLAHCVRMGKKSLRYVEKTAIKLYDDGITETEALQEHLHHVEQMAGAVGKIRAMFGMGTRALSAKEKAMMENWICTMKYEDAVLQKAYEITVDNTGKPSLSYANTVLERWHAAGYRTIADVEKALEDYRNKKKKKGQGQGSFDVDDFFEAAMKRTYGEE